MIQLSKRLLLVSAIVVIAGAILKFFHLFQPTGDYLFYAGFFGSGMAGILEFTSSERNFNTVVKLIASIGLCVAVLLDVMFATSFLQFAIALLAVSFFGSALPRQKIPKKR